MHSFNRLYSRWYPILALSRCTQTHGQKGRQEILVVMELEATNRKPQKPCISCISVQTVSQMHDSHARAKYQNAKHIRYA